MWLVTDRSSEQDVYRHNGPLGVVNVSTSKRVFCFLLVTTGDPLVAEFVSSRAPKTQPSTHPRAREPLVQRRLHKDSGYQMACPRCGGVLPSEAPSLSLLARCACGQANHGPSHLSHSPSVTAQNSCEYSHCMAIQLLNLCFLPARLFCKRKSESVNICVRFACTAAAY